MIRPCDVVSVVAAKADQVIWGRVVQFIERADTSDVDHIVDKLRKAFVGPVRRAKARTFLRRVLVKLEEI